MTTINSTKNAAKSTKSTKAPAEKPAKAEKPAAEKKERTPKTKRLGAQIGRLAARITKLALALGKHGDVTQPIRVALVGASTNLDTARAALDAMPGDALSKKGSGSKTLEVGMTVKLTDKAKAGYTDLLTKEEAEGTFEVVAIVGSSLRVKAANGSNLFIKRGKLARVEQPVTADAAPATK